MILKLSQEKNQDFCDFLLIAGIFLLFAARARLQSCRWGPLTRANWTGQWSHPTVYDECDFARE